MRQNQIILVFKLHCFIDLYIFFNILNVTPVKKRALIIYPMYTVENHYLESSGGDVKSQR